jgi:hypothetical protein
MNFGSETLVNKSNFKILLAIKTIDKRHEKFNRDKYKNNLVR